MRILSMAFACLYKRQWRSFSLNSVTYWRMSKSLFRQSCISAPLTSNTVSTSLHRSTTKTTKSYSSHLFALHISFNKMFTNFPLPKFSSKKRKYHPLFHSISFHLRHKRKNHIAAETMRILQNWGRLFDAKQMNHFDKTVCFWNASLQKQFQRQIINVPRTKVMFIHSPRFRFGFFPLHEFCTKISNRWERRWKIAIFVHLLQLSKANNIEKEFPALFDSDKINFR